MCLLSKLALPIQKRYDIGHVLKFIGLLTFQAYIGCVLNMKAISHKDFRLELLLQIINGFY